jgi:hypothetical protein
MAGRNDVSLGEVTTYAMRHVAELSGREAVGVTAVERTEHGWRVCVEVVELRRIPDTSDILALYETEVGGDGELVSFRRIRRYPRGRTEMG